MGGKAAFSLFSKTERITMGDGLNCPKCGSEMKPREYGMVRKGLHVVVFKCPRCGHELRNYYVLKPIIFKQYMP